MLVFTRKRNEAFYIGDVRVMIVSVRGGKVRVGIEADRETVPIVREELLQAGGGRPEGGRKSKTPRARVA